jgi:hypothetical protein
MATEFRAFKTTALPSNPIPNSFYYISHPSSPTICTIYAIGSTPTEVRTIAAGAVAETTITTVGTDTLATQNMNVLVDSTLGDYTLTLPPVISGVELKLFMSAGSNIVTVEKAVADPSGVIIGSDSFTMDRQWDSITLKSLGGKWFVL